MKSGDEQSCALQSEVWRVESGAKLTKKPFVGFGLVIAQTKTTNNSNREYLASL